MLWACLRFPELALDAVQTASDDARAAPFAVVDGPEQRRHVVFANARAHKSGVRPGHALTAARALCPDLATAPRDADAERLALESVAAFAYRFSADVAIAGPNAVFVEIGGSLALFGGLGAIERRLRSEVAVFGFSTALAVAPTASGAHVLATHADGLVVPFAPTFNEALGLVPIASSGLDGKATAALGGMGFRLLRDLIRLPRPELARRIGPDALRALDRMRGIAPESLPRYRPPDRFERRIELHFGVESHTALAFPLQRLTRMLATHLVARDGGVQRFTLILGHERGASTRIEVGLLAPQRDAASLFELARARFERIELPAPVHALVLLADDLPPLCPLHRDLFDANRREQLEWPALAERLRARLGDNALHGLRCVADHRPNRAWRFAPVGDAMPREVVAQSPALRPQSSSIGAVAANRDEESFPPVTPRHPTRPFWLLERVVRLHAAPARIIAGPERIESGWWDDRDKRRDYYVIETALGQRGWAFVPAGATSGWMLHGWFA